MSRRNDLQALKNLISEAHRTIATTKLPEARSERAEELLRSALALADDLLIANPAAELGKRGGKQTAKRGPDYFRKLAAKRKTHGGGRPRKDTE
jgi:hypothetical protein